nr:hypothetical protein [bacterium]
MLLTVHVVVSCSFLLVVLVSVVLVVLEFELLLLLLHPQLHELQLLQLEDEFPEFQLLLDEELISKRISVVLGIDKFCLILLYCSSVNLSDEASLSTK